MAWAAIWALVRTRAGQWLSGALGYLLLSVGAISTVVGGAVWIKSSIAESAVAENNATWTTKYAAASDKARADADAKRQAQDRAAQLEREKHAAEQSVDAVTARVRDLEAQLAKASTPRQCGYTPTITESLRK